MQSSLNPEFVRFEARRLRALGEGLFHTPFLRQGYVDLAAEYEKLADLLAQRKPPEDKRAEPGNLAPPASPGNKDWP